MNLKQINFYRNSNRKYQIIDHNKLQNLLLQNNWNWIGLQNNKTDVNENFQRLITEVQNFQQRATKIVYAKKQRKPRQPWMTTELLKLVTEKSAAYLRYCSDRENQTLKESFKHCSNKLKKEIRKVKVTYYSKLLEQNKTEPKTFWQIINRVRGKEQWKNKIHEIEVEGVVLNVVEHPSEIGNAFNDYFSKVAENLLIESKLINKNAADRNILQIKNEKLCQTTLNGFQLTTGDVQKAIQKLKNKNSTGTDNISPKTIKNNVISTIL